MLTIHFKSGYGDSLCLWHQELPDAGLHSEYLCGFRQATNGLRTWMHLATKLHIIALCTPRNVRFAAQMELAACFYKTCFFFK